MLRKFISWFLVLFTPCAALAADGETAVLYGTGSVFLNGAQISTSAAVTTGDVIQTRDTGAANLNAAGSSVVVQSNSIVRFQLSGAALDRGSLTVATGKGLTIFARDFKITPTSSEWTEFYVSRVTGVIQVIARKNSVTVSCGANTTTVKEGQQVSRDDAANCGVVEKSGGGAPAAATGAVLNSQWVQYGGIAVGGGLLGWVLLHGDDPVSPSVP
jgi:ferric-dicitrate binding protein FerR (iron transport regulator)